MQRIRLTALILSSVLVASPAVRQQDYGVTYSGGSLPSVKGGQGMHLFLDADGIRLCEDRVCGKNGTPEFNIKASSVTEISYGQEVHRRIGAAVATAVFSLGIGIIVAFSKTKKHYIGLIWAEGADKGGVVLQADKNEFRGILAGLEGLTGKRAVSTDGPGSEPPTSHSSDYGIPPKPDQVLASITVISNPSDAVVEVDGYGAGRTPVDVKLAKGEYTLKVVKPGFQVWSQKITVEPGKAQSVGITLAPTAKPERPVAQQ